MPIISNLMALTATLTLDKSNYENGMRDAKDDASSFSGSLKKGFGLLAKGAAVAYGAAASAASLMAKQAVSAYASYEQLAGGVEKLYGQEYAPKLMALADQAYKTAGMSANAYMETATSFSAALIKSVDGDMDKAVELTDVAMRVISDNVNTFGSNAESVSNAIMGLSRQNYMMIDNLKLGYAGTAQGMMELINDSGVLGEALTSTSQLADVGFATMIEAIQKVQEQQHIAGTTAKEAMTTIEGASNATKAAWQNVITAIGKGEGLKDAFSGLTESLFGVGLLDGKETGLVNLIIPRLETIFESIGEFVADAAPFVTEKLPDLFSAIVPAVMNGATGLFLGLVEAIPALFDSLMSLVMNEGLGLVRSLTEGVEAGLPEFIAQALPMILSFAQELSANIGTIVDAGIALLWALVRGLIQALPDLIQYVPTIVKTFADIINDNLPKILLAGAEMLIALGAGIIENIPVIIANAGEIVEAIISVVSAINWMNLGEKIVKLIGNGIRALANIPIEAIRNIGRSILSTFQSGFSWSSLGYNIVNGIVSGIRGAGGAIVNSLMGFAYSAFDSVKRFFGIASPSKLMRDEIGKYIPEGMALGIEQNLGSVQKAMDDLDDIAFTQGDTEFSSRSIIRDVNITVYGAQGQDVEELAQIVADKINEDIDGEMVVYG